MAGSWPRSICSLKRQAPQTGSLSNQLLVPARGSPGKGPHMLLRSAPPRMPVTMLMNSWPIGVEVSAQPE